MIYITSTIKSLNSVIRKAIKQRNLHPTDASARKAIYLATMDASKKWTMPILNGWPIGQSSFCIEKRTDTDFWTLSSFLFCARLTLSLYKRRTLRLVNLLLQYRSGDIFCAAHLSSPTIPCIFMKHSTLQSSNIILCFNFFIIPSFRSFSAHSLVSSSIACAISG